jgi:hypothetical protein
MSKSTEAAVESKTFNSGTFSVTVTPSTTLAPSAIRKAVKLHGLTGAAASKAVKDFLSFQKTNFADAVLARNSKVGRLITRASGKDWLVSASMAANGRSFTIRADYTGSGSIAPKTVEEIDAAITALMG